MTWQFSSYMIIVQSKMKKWSRKLSSFVELLENSSFSIMSSMDIILSMFLLMLF
jgi:hypothetical protein